MPDIRILVGDVMERLRELPDESVHCCVTSPPYWGLRDYGTASWEGGDADCDHVKYRASAKASTLGPNRDGLGPDNAAHKGKTLGYRSACQKCGAVRVDKQLGLEPTIEEYIERMTAVFEEVRRVLRKDGTLWLNMGDCYAGSWGAQSRTGEETGLSATQIKAHQKGRTKTGSLSRTPGLKPKDLVGQPWRLALSLQQPTLRCNGCGHEGHQSTWGRFPNGRRICPHCVKSKGHEVAHQGWYLRSDIIWAKPNPMPESCRDRPTKAHEYVFLMTKAPRYFFDQEAVKEEAVRAGETPGGGKKWSNEALTPKGGRQHLDLLGEQEVASTRNIRSVWKIATQPFAEAHFATFPTELPRKCIAAGTSEKGCCPECGAPWARVVEKVATGAKQKMPDGHDTGPGAHGSVHREGRQKGEAGRDVLASKTVGWQPGCRCYHTTALPEYPTDPSPAEVDYIRAERLELLAIWARLPAVAARVLDPFGGSGTTALVAAKMGRSAVLIELNPKYAEMAGRRIERECGLLARVTVDSGEPVNA